MQFLYVTEGVPDRSPEFGDGSLMIPFEVIRHLPDGIAVDLLTYDYGRQVPAEIRERCRRILLLEPLAQRSIRRATVLTPFDRGTAERTTARAVRAVRQHEYDVTLLHGPHSLPLAFACPGPVAMQIVDPWSRRLRMDATRLTGRRRMWALHKARQFHRLERMIPRSVALATVGRADAVDLGRALRRPVTAVPNGVDETAMGGTRKPEGPLTVCFVGTLEYGPNVESATALVREVGPVLWRAQPDARIVIAGRRPTPEVLALASDHVQVLPDVPAVSEIYRTSHVAVFPDRLGLGVRNSVTEALVAGIPVVASSIAAREQPVGSLLRVEDGAEGMVSAILDFAASPPSPTAQGSIRTWADATEDYLALCRRAMEARS